MNYAFLIYVSENVSANLTPEERAAYFQEYAAFHGDVIQRGIRQGGAPLQPVATATSIRVRGGRPMVTDGPFAETKEQLAGFYILDCANLDEAILLARRLPDAKYGTIEIRPVIEMNSEQK